MKFIILFLISTSIFSFPTLKEIDDSFNEIANKYELPAELLKVIAYKKSGWFINNLQTLKDNHGEYGIMGLSMEDINLGISILGKYEPVDAILDYKKNIEIFSAILNAHKNDYYNNGIIISKVEDYAPLLVDILYPKYELLSKNVVRKIYNLLRNGYEVTYQNQNLEVEGRLIDIVAGQYPETVLFYKNYTQISSLEDIEFVQAIHRSSRNGVGIDQIIIHIMQGYFEGTISMWTRNSEVESSAHYLVSQDGEILQMVKRSDKAWHAGSHNSRSIGIEHEGFWHASGFTDTGISEAEYQASAMITRWLAERYNIPLEHRDAYHDANGNFVPWQLQRPELANLSGILGHWDTNGKEKCPGGDWDWDYYMGLLDGGGSSIGNLTLLTPTNNETVDNPVTFRAIVDGDIVKVEYFADGQYSLGSSVNSSDNFKVEYQFVGIGEREVSAKGYDANGRYVRGSEVAITINIVDVGSGSVTFIQPINNRDSVNPVIMKANVTGDVTKVKYFAEGQLLIGESNDSSNDFMAERLFNQPGDRVLVARGYNDDDVYITGAEDIINVRVLEVQACNDECNLLNEKRCSNNSVEKCELGSNGCKSWEIMDSCTNDETCRDGRCVVQNCNPNCYDEGAKKCLGQMIQICSNEAGCLRWENENSCSGTKTCDNGECIDSCVDRCTLNEKRCVGDIVEVCKNNFDTDSCTEWGKLKECSSCNNGECVGKLCNKGTKKCQDNKVVLVCSESETEYQFLENCSDNEKCDTGICKPIIVNKPSAEVSGSGWCSYSNNNSNDYTLISLLMLFVLFISKKRSKLNK